MKKLGQIAIIAIVSVFMVIQAKKEYLECESETIETIYYEADMVILPNEIFVLEPEEIPVLDGGDPESEIPILRNTSFVSLTQKEMDLLESIAMAEAEGEDARGKALVMRVVLNRSLEWNKPIDEIIYSPNQFATYRMDIEPTENCHEALAIVIDGWDESEGALWFNANGYPKYGSPLFQYGGHYFSK